MASPGPPVVSILSGTDVEVTVEISQADLAALEENADFLLDTGTATVAGVANPVHVTLSRLVPVPPA